MTDAQEEACYQQRLATAEEFLLISFPTRSSAPIQLKLKRLRDEQSQCEARIRAEYPEWTHREVRVEADRRLKPAGKEYWEGYEALEHRHAWSNTACES